MQNMLALSGAAPLRVPWHGRRNRAAVTGLDLLHGPTQVGVRISLRCRVVVAVAKMLEVLRPTAMRPTFVTLAAATLVLLVQSASLAQAPGRSQQRGV